METVDNIYFFHIIIIFCFSIFSKVLSCNHVFCHETIFHVVRRLPDTFLFSNCLVLCYDTGSHGEQWFRKGLRKNSVKREGSVGDYLKRKFYKIQGSFSRV